MSTHPLVGADVAHRLGPRWVRSSFLGWTLGFVLAILFMRSF